MSIGCRSRAFATTRSPGTRDHGAVRTPAERPGRPADSVRSGARAVLDSAALTASVKKCYPERKSGWLQGYILGRCIFSALRRPVDCRKLASVIGLVSRDPGVGLRGLVQLAHAALKSHLAW